MRQSVSMKERGPGEYQPKHSKHISLDYRGVASDLMDVNVPVADGYMRVSDMRADIVVVQKPHDRALDYDQIGHTRVAKVLSLPRFEFWKQKSLRYTKKEDNTWFIAVDDQAISQEVADSNNGGKFDDAFTVRFQQEVIQGLRGVLQKEKLLNSGNYNISFYAAYETVGLWYPVLLSAAGAMIAGGEDPLQSVARVAGVGVVVNTAYNSLDLLAVGWGKVRNAILPAPRFKLPNEGSVSLYPSYGDPFIRHSVFELPLPLYLLID